MSTNWIFPLTRQTFDAPCVVEIGHTAESLFAHVEIDGDFEIRAGDQVLVQDAPEMILESAANVDDVLLHFLAEIVGTNLYHHPFSA